MLLLRRSLDEGIVIGGRVTVTRLETARGRALLGGDAPEDMRINRDDAPDRGRRPPAWAAGPDAIRAELARWRGRAAKAAARVAELEAELRRRAEIAAAVEEAARPPLLGRVRRPRA